MAENDSEHLISHNHPLADNLNIPERESRERIGTLIICGQGPVQDSATKVNLGKLEKAMPGSISAHEANTWMRLNARAAGELGREGDVGLIIASGKDTGGSYSKGGEHFIPTEAELMQEIIENVYGQKAPQSEEKFSQAEIELDREAKNTLFNIINAANIIDSKKEVNPNDPNLNNVWLLGSHFHMIRLKILASLFGLDPKKVLSAEDVLMNASKIKQQELDNKGITSSFQEAFRRLIQVRLSGAPIDEAGKNYFERKMARAEALLDRAIDQYLSDQGVPQAGWEQQRKSIKEKLFIEEQKDAQARMRGERRWARGLAMEPDYTLPYSVNLRSDDRLLGFLLKFDSKTLEKYGIQKEELEAIAPENKTDAVKSIRAKIDPDKWSSEVVKKEWEDEEYPPEVKARLLSIGISEEDIEYLSKAEVSKLG
ncbi:MAG: YdcF family protein [Patescibacteria group bacterium]|nr:YdcF family protein [Patescibacteria group bacterium]